MPPSRRRLGQPAGQGHLAPGHQPAPAERPHKPDSPQPAADLGGVVWIYGIRQWIEQGYDQAKDLGIRHWTEPGYDQVKDELGWADFRQRPRPSAALINSVTAGCGLHPYLPEQQIRR